MRVIICLLIVLFSFQAHAGQLIFEGFETAWTPPNTLPSGLTMSQGAGASPCTSGYGVERNTNASYVRTGTASAMFCDVASTGPYLEYQMAQQPTDGTEYYVRFYIWYPTGFDFSAVSDTNWKYFRFHSYYNGAAGSDGSPIGTMQYWDGVTPRCGNNQIQWNAAIGPSYTANGSCYGASGNTSACQAVPLGQWVKVEIYMKYSSTSGGMWFKIADTLVAGSETLNCDTFPIDYGLPGNIVNYIRIMSNGFPASHHIYIDDLEIHDSIPVDPTPIGGRAPVSSAAAGMGMGSAAAGMTLSAE